MYILLVINYTNRSFTKRTLFSEWYIMNHVESLHHYRNKHAPYMYTNTIYHTCYMTSIIYNTLLMICITTFY